MFLGQVGGQPSGQLKRDRVEGILASCGKPQLPTNKSLGTSTFKGFIPDVRTNGVNTGLMQIIKEVPKVRLPEIRHSGKIITLT